VKIRIAGRPLGPHLLHVGRDVLPTLAAAGPRGVGSAARGTADQAHGTHTTSSFPAVEMNVNNPLHQVSPLATIIPPRHFKGAKSW
jgi:hypothetical protein